MNKLGNMRKKLHVKKGDTVKVISGNSKGQQGKIRVVLREKNRAIVEGVNLVSKHTKPSANNPKGGILKQEAPIHVSNLMIVDKQGNVTRISRSTDEQSGKRQRVSKKSGEVIK